MPEAMSEKLIKYRGMADDRKGKLVILFILFLFLLNFPILSIFDHADMVLGIPKMYLYLFALWLLLIVLTAWIVRNRK
jgi:hypothetical protein